MRNFWKLCRKFPTTSLPHNSDIKSPDELHAMNLTSYYGYIYSCFLLDFLSAFFVQKTAHIAFIQLSCWDSTFPPCQGKRKKKFTEGEKGKEQNCLIFVSFPISPWTLLLRQRQKCSNWTIDMQQESWSQFPQGGCAVISSSSSTCFICLPSPQMILPILPHHNANMY